MSPVYYNCMAKDTTILDLSASGGISAIFAKAILDKVGGQHLRLLQTHSQVQVCLLLHAKVQLHKGKTEFWQAGVHRCSAVSNSCSPRIPEQRLPQPLHLGVEVPRRHIAEIVQEFRGEDRAGEQLKGVLGRLQKKPQVRFHRCI